MSLQAHAACCAGQYSEANYYFHAVLVQALFGACRCFRGVMDHGSAARALTQEREPRSLSGDPPPKPCGVKSKD